MANYQEETLLRTRDGMEVWVRPERPGDAHHLVQLFQNLSPASRYLRFSKDATAVGPEAIQQRAQELAQDGPPHDMAWLAFADLPGEPGAAVAAARYVRLGGADDTGELAISVRDDVQRRGLGSQLLDYILEQARADGIRRLVATFQSTNQGVWGLLRRSPYQVHTRLDGSMAYAEVDLTQPVDRSDDTLASRPGG